MDLQAVARGAAEDAGGLDPALLGDFLEVSLEVTGSKRRLRKAELSRYADQGAAAALAGVPLRATVDLYLSASWRLWAELPATGTAAEVRASALAMLRAADDGVAALCEGFQVARNDLSRRQESDRREVFDALLAGGADAARVVGRAASLGLDLAMPHAVYVVDLSLDASTAGRLERALQGRRGDAGVLLAEKDGRTALIVNAPDAEALRQVSSALRKVLGSKRTWLAAVGSPENGPDGVRASYVQALQTLDLAVRLALPGPVVEAGELVAFRALLRDRSAAQQLVLSALGPLTSAKGGAAPLLATLETWFETGTNTTETARALHLSVRAVTYRLARVKELLGVHPADPSRRFTLHAAVVAARLLGWPDASD